MTTEELIEQTKKLIAIPSVTKDLKSTHKAYEYMVRYLKARTEGKNVTIEEFEQNGIPSFLAYRGKKRPANFRILLNVHVDVVDAKPHQFKPQIKDGKLYGRGSHDMKAAAVILADAFAEYVDKVPYALAYQLVTDEEVGGLDGVAYQIKKGVRADFVICGECGRQTHAHEIANEAKGIIFTEIVFRGRAGHGAYPWRNSSPITKATKFIAKLHERFPIPTKPYSGTTMSVTGFHADGGAYTRVPDIATIRLDVRFAPGDANFRSEAHFAALIEEIDPEAELKNYQMGAPLYCDPKNPLLLSLKTSAEKVEKVRFSFVRRHATSDGRHFGEVGDQACEFGVAGEHQHGDDEYVTIQAFKNYRDIIYDFLEKITTEKKHTHTKASN